MGKTKTQLIGETAEVAKGKKQKRERPDKIHLSGQKGGERVKIIEAPLRSGSAGTSEGQAPAKKREPRTRGKKYLEAKAKIDRNRLYPAKEAINLVKETSMSSFDGTVELHLVVKKVGLSATLTLPHEGGKAKKVEVASEETVKKLEKGKVDFDVLLATPEMMPKLVPFARLLGPRGLMPNPKNGTIIKTAKDAEKFNAAKLTVKTEKNAPVIHIVVGKVSMKELELAGNVEAVLTAVNKKQIVKAYLTSTMGPSVKVIVA